MKGKPIELKNPKYFGWLLTAFITLLIASNVIAGRLIDIGGLIITSAVVFFPLSYVISDIVPEVYGYGKTRKLIWYGALANLMMVAIFFITGLLPTPVWFEPASAYALVLGVVPRIVIASIIGYTVGNFVNAFILAKMKVWMIKWDPKHKYLFLRTIGSTIGGEGVDSLLFITGAFLFVMPFADVMQMVLVQWLVKVLIEAVMTPVTMLVCNKLKKAEGIDVVGAKSYSPFAREK